MEHYYPVHGTQTLLNHVCIGQCVGVLNPSIPPLLGHIEDWDDQYFNDYSARLPMWERKLLEHVTPEGPHAQACRTLLDESQNPDENAPGFLAVSDGSVKNAQGKFGWVVALNAGMILVRSKGPACGYKIDLYCAEGYGQLSQVTYINHSAICFNLPLQKNLQSYTNSLSFIDVIKKILESSRPLFPSDTLVPSYDIIQAFLNMWKKLSNLSLNYVPGHRDRKVNPKQLKIEEKLNIEADRLAGEFQEESDHRDDPVPFIEGVVADLVISGQTITAHHRKESRNMRKTRWLHDRIQQKLVLQDDVFDNIDWSTHTSTITNFKGSSNFLTEILT